MAQEYPGRNKEDKVITEPYLCEDLFHCKMLKAGLYELKSIQLCYFIKMSIENITNNNRRSDSVNTKFSQLVIVGNLEGKRGIITKHMQL